MDQNAQMALLALVGQFVLAADVLLILVWGFRRIVLHKATFAPRWSLADLWWGGQLALALLVLLLVPLFLMFFVASGSSVKPGEMADMSNPAAIRWLVVPSTLLQNVAFWLVPVGYFSLKYGVRLRDVGVPSLPTRRDWAAGITIGLLVVVAMGIMEAGISAVAGQFRHVAWVQAALEYEKSNPVAQIIRTLPKLGVGTLLLAVLAIGISAPLGEEMLFRGFAFNVFKNRFRSKRWGLAVSLIASALLFTLPHSYALGLLPVFLMGLLLAWVYHNSGSLWVGIIIHAVNNTLAVLLAYFFPGAS